MRCSWTLRFLAVLVVVGWMAPPAAAQETKSARGSVTALGPTTLSVKAGAVDLTFTVDPKTELVAAGAGTAERRADAAGRPGPRLADFLAVGDAVEVRYQDMGAMLHARRIQKVSSAGPAGGMTSDARAMASTGSVTTVSGAVLTISGSTGGGGTFTQSFTVDRETKVVAAGAGTAAAARGGTLALTDAVGVGDQVSVSYRKMGDRLHAAEIRVTAKKR
ncbi:MAG: DUF5666 domain-containing protein [Vicinamibacterales bacterium]